MFLSITILISKFDSFSSLRITSFILKDNKEQNDDFVQTSVILNNDGIRLFPHIICNAIVNTREADRILLFLYRTNSYFFRFSVP